MQVESSLDHPRAADFLEPYIFFASREASEVTVISPSVRQVLGYDPEHVQGRSCVEFLCPDDPLNQDVPECQRRDLSDGSSIHALRCVRDRDGQRRILSVHTNGVSDIEGGPVVRRHSIARDVTESVQMHMQLMMRLQLLEHAARRLNRQERDVAEKIMEGKLNRQIARELDISDRTVERRRAAILKHLNAATTPEVVSQLVERELLRRWLRASSDLQWQSARNAHLALAAVAL